MNETLKVLDSKGVEYLWSKISLQDYPNNETLISVINAIDETKADKSEIPFIDDTLILEGAAADAAAVGEALTKIHSVPECTIDDNGKFLCVVNGVATWTTILNAEEVKF